jgi:hypothetical protein
MSRASLRWLGMPAHPLACLRSTIKHGVIGGVVILLPMSKLVQHYHHYAQFICNQAPHLHTAAKPHGAIIRGNAIVNQEPVLVPIEAAKGGKIVALKSGTEHVLALNDAGKVFVWSSAKFLGTINAAIPKAVQDVGAKAIAAGPGYSLALLKDGRVVCW